MHHMLQRQKIKRYLLENFLFSTDDSALGDQDSLIRGGILDSTWCRNRVTSSSSRSGERASFTMIDRE